MTISTVITSFPRQRTIHRVTNKYRPTRRNQRSCTMTPARRIPPIARSKNPARRAHQEQRRGDNLLGNGARPIGDILRDAIDRAPPRRPTEHPPEPIKPTIAPTREARRDRQPSVRQPAHRKAIAAHAGWMRGGQGCRHNLKGGQRRENTAKPVGRGKNAGRWGFSESIRPSPPSRKLGC